jgi:predicted transcriptional regulator
MPILKSPPVQPTNESLQLRVSQDLKSRLAAYADFIHANASYVVSEALERLFRKDTDFHKYLSSYKPSEAGEQSKQEVDLQTTQSKRQAF